MNTIKKLSELAAYLKQVVATYSQHDYGQLHQVLRARYEQMVVEAFMDRHPGWSVVEGNAACMMYLYRNWSFSRKAEENQRGGRTGGSNPYRSESNSRRN